MLVHETNVLRLRNIPLLVIYTLFIHEHIFTFRPLCLHSITKILRNGPRAHFPFKLIQAQVFYFCKREHLVMLSQRNICVVIINNMVSRHLITIKEMKMIRT
jgi:hypothetical protein